MTARFPAMIGLIRNSLKIKKHSCACPANKLCIDFLRILRENGFIFGFTMVHRPRRLQLGFFHGYPRVRIFFKYTDRNLAVIKDLRSYKNTRSNFYIWKIRSKGRSIVGDHHKLFLISTTAGLVLTSLADLYNKVLFKNPAAALSSTGKLLAEITI